MGIQNNLQNSNSQTPYTLTFGLEAIAPVELIWPTTRIKNYNVIDNDEAMMIEQENREEIREAAYMKESSYKRKIERYYNAKVRKKNLVKGDLVLRNAQSTDVEQEKGKLSSNWKGPYVIKEVVKEGTYILMKEDGKALPRTWNINSLKKFYA